MNDRRNEKQGACQGGSAGVTEGGRRPTEGNTALASQAPRHKRWTAARKAEVVRRMLRGEPVDSLSRELAVPVYRLEEWREKALTGLETALKSRKGDPVQTELDAALKRVGELTMDVELLEAKIDVLEARRPLPRRRSRR